MTFYVDIYTLREIGLKEIYLSLFTVKNYEEMKKIVKDNTDELIDIQKSM